MKHLEIRSNLILLLTAAIWGLAFTAQRVGAQYVGPFTLNGIRFAIGSLSLLPLLIFFSKKAPDTNKSALKKTSAIFPGIIAGAVLFAGASLQQMGLAHTSAGKAAFITGLYIVLVPILGIFLKHRIHLSIWLGAILAVIGLYLLSVTEKFTITNSDLFELIGAFFWAGHILVIDYYTKKMHTLTLCIIQFLTSSVLSLIVALGFESLSLTGIGYALLPILYLGICSTGIAYTLQVVGQKHAKPSHAAIILSMEAVFASLGGLIILHENLGARGYLGCLLMLAGMIIAQLPNIITKKSEPGVSIN
jgi:drug/metabolite transporter (DMT)-like permease